jgi:hypothetical protein
MSKFVVPTLPTPHSSFQWDEKEFWSDLSNMPDKHKFPLLTADEFIRPAKRKIAPIKLKLNPYISSKEKKEKRLARNRLSAALSRQRRSQQISVLVEENQKLKERVTELERMLTL